MSVIGCGFGRLVKSWLNCHADISMGHKRGMAPRLRNRGVNQGAGYFCQLYFGVAVPDMLQECPEFGGGMTLLVPSLISSLEETIESGIPS
eukprot:930037-Ditylum_brightwellii.AAC.1